MATMDLRLLIRRFRELWGKRPPRCRNSQQCSGNSPDDCMRFKGGVIQDQSAHDWTCASRDECWLVPWDRSSYKQVVRAASVRADHATAKVASYCEASDRTCVSPVWAHGQGGRPEKGINFCLHHRYCTLAKELGCDSYWIDTMCGQPPCSVLRFSMPC